MKRALAIVVLSLASLGACAGSNQAVYPTTGPSARAAAEEKNRPQWGADGNRAAREQYINYLNHQEQRGSTER